METNESDVRKKLEPECGIDDIAPVQKTLTDTDYYVNLVRASGSSDIDFI